jgi:signal transduction histidine kinase
VQSLSTNIDHIKHIVSLQQSLAGTSGLIEEVSLAEVLEDAIRINSSSIARHRIEIIRQFQELPNIAVDKQKLLHILVNLISNAKYSLIESEQPEKRLVVRMGLSSQQHVRIDVEDNGVGIAPENMTRIFTYGFTTKKDGHGFGLHSASLAAKEMKWTLSAHSDGPGTGATFTLDLPFKETGVSLCTN